MDPPQHFYKTQPQGPLGHFFGNQICNLKEKDTIGIFMGMLQRINVCVSRTFRQGPNLIYKF